MLLQSAGLKPSLLPQGVILELNLQRRQSFSPVSLGKILKQPDKGYSIRDHVMHIDQHYLPAADGTY
ncbi:hypothetical protein D3C78_1421410 [compost metagenome]